MVRVFLRRVERVRQLMQEQEIDCLLLAPTTNMFYLTGLRTVPDERLQLAVLPVDGPLTLVLPEMYRETAANLPVEFTLLTWPDHQDAVALMRPALSVLPGRVAIDDKMWTGHYFRLRRAFPGAEFVAAQDLLDQVRACKDEWELSLLEQSGELADQVMGETVRAIREGISEIALVTLIEKSIKDLGGEDLAFRPIVASGPNAARPHHRSGRRVLQQGDLVILDFGGVVSGYCSDITRTFCLGKAAEDVQEIYRVVQAANEAGFRAAGEGVACQEVDRAARQVIASRGFGQYFNHRTGHGIGLDGHEAPYILEGNPAPLRQGMVFSVEPGIYLPGRLGVRIEDVVAITGEGPRRFNDFPRELLML